MSESKSAKRLGRGLSSLIVNSSDRTQAETPSGQPLQVRVKDICPNPYQPRRVFAEDELARLAESIQQQGILQPLVVRQAEEGEVNTAYVLVAGERRLRAASLAGLEEVPCVLKQANDQQMIEWALIENIHRTDLNPIERAAAYQEYIDRYRLTHSEAGEKLGVPRATISNHLRLLELPADVQRLVGAGELSFGHAKVLAGLAGDAERQSALGHRGAEEALSVRELEALCEDKAYKKSLPAEAEGPKKRDVPSYIRDLEEQLTEAIGTRVTIKPGRAKNSGRIVVEYYNLDDFERIANALGAKLEP